MVVMDFKELRKYQKQEKRSELGKLPDRFWEEVQEYCKNLEANKDYNTLSNVLSIMNVIKTQRLKKIFDTSIGYLYHHTQEDDLDKLQEFAPNMISCELALFRDIIQGLFKYDHYLTSDCEYLKR